MNFIKRISRPLIFAAGVRGRTPRWIAVCALLAAAAGGLAQFHPAWPRRVQAEPAAARQGEAAIQQLKANGSYASLAAALAAARAPLTMDSTLTQQQKLAAADAAALDQFGAAVAISGDTAVIGAPLDDLKGVSNQGSVYVFVRNETSWSLQQKLIASDGVAGDGFGSALAISGDTLVVGVFSDDIGANVDQGSAYIFTRSSANGGAVWTEQQKLIAADGAASHHFGFSVAISGDTAVVGAQGDDIGANGNQGSAYVFTRNGALWIEQQKLIASDGATGDNFGFSVSLSGDTVVVGAALDDTGRNVNHGSAYVFTRSGVVWMQQAKLLASDGAANDQFGASVSLSGDTVVVGAPFDDIGANTDEGSAYIFTRTFPPTGTTWTQQQKLTAVGIDGLPGDNFGASVAFNGRSVVVGAAGAENKRGAAHVFTNNGVIWTEQAKLTAGDGAANDQFGRSVALSNNTVLAGAPNNSGAFTGQGASYVFVTCAGDLVQQQQLTASDGAAFRSFGSSVALSGDTAVVGLFEGAAYVFTRSGTRWTQQQKLTANEVTAGELFGSAVSLSGDTIVVGAPRPNIGRNANQGSAYVFTRSGALWTLQQKLTPNVGGSGNGANDEFGFSVAVSGDTVAVGSRDDTFNANVPQGSVYVFTRGFTTGGAVWTEMQKLTASDGEAGDQFGTAVSLSGDTVVVGALFGGAVPFGTQGAVYAFTRSGTFWTQQQKLAASDGAAFDRFGASVAVSGETVVVGAFDDAIGTNVFQGSAYVFTRGFTNSGVVWTERQKLTASDGAAIDLFGISVAVSGDTVVVGADGDDIGASMNQGSAYIFACPTAP